MHVRRVGKDGSGSASYNEIDCGMMLTASVSRKRKDDSAYRSQCFIVVPVDLNLPERIQENKARVLDIWCGASGLVSGLFMVSIQ